MSVSFGQRLRQRREQCQVTIDAIAAQTKINPTMLRGLERDDLSRWPAGIFRRSYIRAYAAAIGLDPDEVAREFLALYPDSVVVLPPSAVVWPEQVSEREAPPAGRRLGRLVSAIASVPTRLRWPGSANGSIVNGQPDPETPGHAGDLGAAEPGAAEEPTDHHAVDDIIVDDRTVHRDPDFAAFAQLCTRLAQADDTDALTPVIADAASMLHAVGLIVWSAKPCGTMLVPALVHGYPESVRARLTAVPADAENAVGLAYRRRETSIVDGDGVSVSGGLAAPLLGRRRCVGVLALELPAGVERLASIRACVVILAAQLVSAPLSRPHAAAPHDLSAAR